MNATDSLGAGRSYVLGHSDQELERLRMQASFIDPTTRQYFADAGVSSGMRVLDVGTGAGDVAFLAADMVGETGEVIGVDRSAKAIVAARARATARSSGNISFREGDPSEIRFDCAFDAVVGRYVLQFQSDAGAMLRRLAQHVRPGGLIVFHEVDWAGARSIPPCPTFDECCRLIVDTFRLLGTQSGMGLGLNAAFVAAGLPTPTMRIGAAIGGGANSAGPALMVARLVGTMLPDMERLGVASGTDLNIETLPDRIVAEAVANGSVLVAWFDVGAWCRV
jgi:2-polyprenyl-3-methyl-5-hydroxy-6-metoxy-1,4-benzoquinol methylase